MLMLPSMLALAAVNLVSHAAVDESWDVIIYACTPAGFSAALGAKAAGAAKVLVLEPTAHVGGMAAAGGIGLRDGVLIQPWPRGAFVSQQ